MKRCCLVVSCCSLALLASGCGGGSEEPKTSQYRPEKSSESDSANHSEVAVVSTANSAESSPAVTGSPSQAAKDLTNPESVVERYLTALQDEDFRTAEDLLTQAARDAFYQSRLQPSLPGSASARCEVGSVRFATQKKERGYVETTWHETDAQGQVSSYNVDVYVRQEVPGEWRVAGLMMGVDQGEFVFFNFEDAADMIAKTQGAGPETRQADAGNSETFR